jgi:8-oxo-dGTP diphosphatase
MPGAFDVSPLLPANTVVLAALTLPPVYGISCASELGEASFLARAAGAFERGLRLVQVREKEWSAPRVRAFAMDVRELAHRHGAKVLLNGDEALACELGLDGVHWTSARLAQSPRRPDGMLVGASCHSAAELAQAARLNCSFAVLGPVFATPTHPGVATLGWDGFAREIAGARVPVYALGGLTPDDLSAAIDCGAHGIAMRRGAW